MWVIRLIACVVTCISTINAEVYTAEVPPDCVEFRRVLESTVVEFAAGYFADNPRGDGEPIIPNQIDPLTAQSLFIAYYGKGASAINFKTALMRLVYADPGEKPSGSRLTQEALIEADRVALRESIYIYLKAGSYDLAREKFGLLLYKGVDEIGGEEWKKFRCVDDEMMDKVRNIIFNELSRIRNEGGEYQIAQLLGLGSGTTLAFAIDDTGSMSGEIDAAKRRATRIIDERQGSLDQPQNFVLVPFNDPDVGPLTVTHDPDEFKDAISRLYAHGGGDAPELCMRGIQLAVENSNAGSSIFVITDVEAKDIELQDNVVAQAKQKDIKVTFLLTNRVTGSMCRRGSYNRRAACKNKSLKSGYELYEYIATSTGGRILVVTKQDIFKATEVIASTLKQGLVEIFKESFDAGDHTVSFPVDSSLTRLFLQTVGDCGSPEVVRPDGEAAKQMDRVGVNQLVEVQIAVDRTYGLYQLIVKNNKDCDVKISARSTKGIVKTLAKEVIDTNTGEKSLIRFEGQALHNDHVTVLIDEFGKQEGDKTETIEIHDVRKKSIRSFNTTDDSDNHFSVPIDWDHGKQLMVIVKGVDKMGYEFQRVCSGYIEFVSLDIDCSRFTNMVFRAGDKVNVKVKLRSLAAKAVTFSVEASDDKQFVEAAPPKKITVKPGSTAKFPVTVKSKEKNQTGTVSTITITAKPENGGLIFKQCRLILGQRERPDIESFTVVSNINSRFVETSVSSTVYNNATVGRTAEFNVIMPIDAFITEFSMTIDNETYPGEIKEKEEAKKIFGLAKARGLTAGHVAAREESTTVFKTSVNLEAQKRVIFNLKYQELLRRSRGRYRHEVIIQTKQPVGKLSVDVYICENRPLTFVDVLGFDTEQTVKLGPITLPGVSVEKQSTTAHISFKPTREEQLKLSPLGLNGKFITEYDVTRRDGKDVNEVVASDRHFIHFYTPDLTPMRKRVVFLLDTSASMYGHKMEQLRKAMMIIIAGLSSEDHFAIVTFNSNTTRWNHGADNTMVFATDANKAAAIQFLNDSKAQGSTNMAKAINESINVLRGFVEENEKIHHVATDYVLMLTDGRPTEGKVGAAELVDFVDRTNNRSFGIHTIGFGSLVDAKTLAKIAARNNGSSIQIFEDIDADIQIVDFFETIARPMLRDIEVKYSPLVESTSIPTFPVICFGSEIVITGRYFEEFGQQRRRKRQVFAAELFEFSIRGKGKDGDFEISDSIKPAQPSTECLKESTQIKNFTERLSVFMELQHALKEIAAENNNTLIQQMKDDVVNKSLKYGFVTPGMTSMVVLKPNDKKELEDLLAIEEMEEEKEEERKAKEEDREMESSDLYAGRTMGGARSFALAPSMDGGGGGGGGYGRGGGGGGGGYRGGGRRARPGAGRGDSVSRIIGGIARPRPMPTHRPSLHRDSPYFTTTTRPFSSHGALRYPLPTRSYSAYGGPPPPTRSYSVYGDPHFVIDLQDQITICFDWQGYEGEIVNLLHDRVKGITVNGRLSTLRNPKKSKQWKTFIDEIGILLDHQKLKLLITCTEIIIDEPKGQTRLSLSKSGEYSFNGVTIRLDIYSTKGGVIIIETGENISFGIGRHIVSEKDNTDLDHLDFVITKSEGISSNAFGIVGQFSANAENLHRKPKLITKSKHKGKVFYRGRSAAVTRSELWDFHLGQKVECWNVKEVGKILDAEINSYLLQNIFDKPGITQTETALTPDIGKLDKPV